MLRYVLAFIALSCAGTALAQGCYSSSVLSPAPFLGNHGEIVKLADGSLWEIQHSYEYLYDYYPSIVICPRSGKLLVKNKTFNVLSVGNTSRQKSGATVVESTIASKFDGLNRGNIYILANGQIWEQIEAWSWVWIWSNPSVIIYSGPSGWQMKVENIDHTVLVQKIK